MSNFYIKIYSYYKNKYKYYKRGIYVSKWIGDEFCSYRANVIIFKKLHKKCLNCEAGRFDSCFDVCKNKKILKRYLKKAKIIFNTQDKKTNKLLKRSKKLSKNYQKSIQKLENKLIELKIYDGTEESPYSESVYIHVKKRGSIRVSSHKLNDWNTMPNDVIYEIITNNGKFKIKKCLKKIIGIN